MAKDKIDTETRKLVGELIKWFLTGELEGRIEMEKIKSEDDPDVSGIDYSSFDGSSGGSGGAVISMIDNFEADKKRAKYRMIKLEKIQKIIKVAWRLIDENYKKILNLYFKEKFTNQQIGNRLGYSVSEINRRKKTVLNQLAKYLNFTKEKDEIIMKIK